MSHKPVHSRSSSGWGKKQKQPPDPLEQAGFVSKGDISLLNVKAQETYFRHVMDRYAQFCKDHSGDLDGAFASLPRNPSDDATKNPPGSVSQKSDSKNQLSMPNPQAAKDLSLILVSLRKLREAILATAADTHPAFAQEVHVFCVRTALLASHPPSYYPPLERLMERFNNGTTTLGWADLNEFVTYLVLDYACRQGNYAAAINLRQKAKQRIAYQNGLVDCVLTALLHDNWCLFWETRQYGDGYVRSLMDWAADSMQMRALKAIGKSYFSVDLDFLLECCAGRRSDFGWEELVQKHNLGWKRDEDRVIIRAKKSKSENAE